MASKLLFLVSFAHRSRHSVSGTLEARNTLIWLSLLIPGCSSSICLAVRLLWLADYTLLAAYALNVHITAVLYSIIIDFTKQSK